MNNIQCPLISFLAIVFIMNLSCNEDNSSKSAENIDSYYHLNIVINSPYSCYDEIELKNSGSANYVYGFRRSNQDSIIGRKSFAIDFDSVKFKINEIIKNIKARPPVDSPRAMDDGFQFTLTIDNMKFIDRYGQDSLLDKILFELAPYINNEELGECDFFNLLKKSH